MILKAGFRVQANISPVIDIVDSLPKPQFHGQLETSFQTTIWKTSSELLLHLWKTGLFCSGKSQTFGVYFMKKHANYATSIDPFAPGMITEEPKANIDGAWNWQKSDTNELLSSRENEKSQPFVHVGCDFLHNDPVNTALDPE